MIKIQLDANALTALFPVGSESFLALQQACLTEASKRAIRAMSRIELEATLKDLSFKLGKEIKDELIREFGPRYQDYRAGPEQVSLSDNIRAAIRKSVEEQITKVLNTQMEYFTIHSIKRKVDELAGKVISDKLNEIIDSELDEQIKTKLREKLKTLL